MSPFKSPSRLARADADCFVRRFIVGLMKIADAEAAARLEDADALARALAERELERLTEELQLALDLYVESRIRAYLGAMRTEETIS